jgi:hypothetical protein
MAGGAASAGDVYFDLKVRDQLEADLRAALDRAARLAKKGIPVPAKLSALAGSTLGAPGGARAALATQSTSQLQALAATANRLSPQARPGGIDAAAVGMAALTGKVSNVLGALGPFGVALVTATGTMLGFVGAASPNALSTFTVSLEMVSAKIGRLFIPAIEEAAANLQTFAAVLDKLIPRKTEKERAADLPESQSAGSKIGWGLLKMAVPFAGPAWGGPQVAGGVLDLIKGGTEDEKRQRQGALNDIRTGGAKALVPGIGPWWGAGQAFGGLTRLGANLTGVKPVEDAAKSEKGLPRSQYSSFEDYASRLDVAGLMADTAEGKLAADQLANIKITAVNTTELVNQFKAFLASNPQAFRN